MPTPGAAHASTTVTLRCQFCQTWNRVDAQRAANHPKCGQCAKPLLLDRPVPLDDDTFTRVIAESTIPVLVDFYAEWCGPCKVMAPAVDELAARMRGKALVAKLNTDHAPRTSSAFSVRAIPTVIVFRDGKEVERHSGALPLAVLEALVAPTAA